MHEPVITVAESIQKFMDAKYCKADLNKLTQECKQLSKDKQQKLSTLLKRHEELLEITVGTWNTDPADLTLRNPIFTTCHAKPYPVPHSQEKKLRDKVERLRKQEILRKINRSEQVFFMFVISKPNGFLRF